MADQILNIVLTATDKGVVGVVKGSREELDRLGASSKRASTEMDQGFGLAAKGAGVLKAQIAGLLAGLTVGAFSVWIKETISWGDELSKLSTELGTTTEALSDYQFVAERSGTTLDAVTNAWGKQQKAIAEASAGMGEARVALKALGLDLNELIRLAPDQQFEQLAEALSQVENSSDRTAIAMKVWGEAGAEMIRIADGGAQGIEELRQRNQELGGQLSSMTAKEMAEFDDSLADMSAALRGVAATLFDTLKPALQSSMDWLADFAATVGRAVDSLRAIRNRTNTEGLRQSLKEAQGEYDDLTKRINEAKAAEDRLTESRLWRERMNLKMQTIGGLETRIGQLTEEYEKWSAESEAARVAGGKLTGAMNELKESHGKAGGAARSHTQDLKKLEDQQLRLAAQYGSTAALAALEAMRVAEVTNALIAYGATAEEIAAAQARVHDEIYKTGDALKKTGQELDTWGELAKSTIDRLDNYFADLWKNLFTGAKDTFSSLKDFILQWLAEMAHALLTKPLIVGIGASLGIGGANAGTLGGTGGTGGTGGGGFLSGLGSLFSGTSIGENIAKGLGEIFGSGTAGGWWSSGLGNLASVPNWGLTLGALGGGLLGGALFGGKGYGGVGSSLGSTAGSIVGGFATGGPVGALIGGLLGGVGGGFLGSLFGDDEPVPRVKAGVQNGWLVSTGVEDIEPDQLEQLKAQAAAINQLIGLLRYSFGERGKAAVEDYNEPVMGFDPEDLARAGNQVLQAVLDRAAASGDLIAQWISEQVDGKLGETLEESAEAVVGLVNQLMYLPAAFEAFDKLGLSLGEGGEQAAIYALEIAKLMGGMEELLTAEQFYYENFFSEQERLQKTYDDAKKTIVAFNKELGLSGYAMIDTREELRKYIEGLDLTTEEGRKAYAAALSVAGSIVVLEDSLASLDDTIGDVGDSARGTGRSLEEIAAQFDEIAQAISGMFSDTRDMIWEFGQPNEVIYKKIKAEADDIIEGIGDIDDPEELERRARKVDDLIRRGWSLLDDDTKLKVREEWLEYIDKVDEKFEGRLDEIREEEIGAAEAMQEAAKNFSASVVDFSAAVKEIKEVAKAFPRNITVTVRERTSEVG